MFRCQYQAPRLSPSEGVIVPREELKIPQRLETLSVLSADGRLDKALEPQIDESDLLKLYKTMLASRRLDERCLMLQRQGRMGTYGPSKGQEAASLGIDRLLIKPVLIKDVAKCIREVFTRRYGDDHMCGRADGR